MAQPFRKEHWDILFTAANNFKDIRRFDYEGNTTDVWHFHDGFNNAISPVDEPFWTNDTRAYDYYFETANVEETNVWLRSKLTLFQDRVTELWNNAQLAGDYDPPWPEDDTILTESAMTKLKHAVHWSPHEYTDKWVSDNFGTSYYEFGWIDNLYFESDLHYYQQVTYFYENQPGDWYRVTSVVEMVLYQPHVEKIQVFPPNLVTGATLDWVARHDYFDNIRGPWKAGDDWLVTFEYWNTIEPYAYRTLHRYPIEDDGTCDLTYQAWSGTTYIQDDISWDDGGAYVQYLHEYGDSTQPYNTCLALNLDDAVFV